MIKKEKCKMAKTFLFILFYFCLFFKPWTVLSTAFTICINFLIFQFWHVYIMCSAHGRFVLFFRLFVWSYASFSAFFNVFIFFFRHIVGNQRITNVWFVNAFFWHYFLTKSPKICYIFYVKTQGKVLCQKI